ncbi:MAG: hypothetical protein IKZ01_01335 [Anaerotignum sp.]|nr:hypothetical protein [Anaerotignum sp.]MBR5121922.1 hypothetical protein [Anaerotignum sp.]
MANKEKKLRINGDTMTNIVMFSLAFCAGVVIYGLWQSTKGVDCSAIVDSALRVFGTELGICGIMTIFKRWTDAQDRRTEERRRRRAERNGGNDNDNIC